MRFSTIETIFFLFRAMYVPSRTKLAALVLPSLLETSDAGISFVYNTRTKRNVNDHDVIRNLSILSHEGREAKLESFETEMRLFAPTDEEISGALKDRLPERGKYAVLVPGSVWNTKMWKWQGFRSVAEFLLSVNIPVVLLGASSDKHVCESVSKGLPITDLSGQTSISDAMYIMKHAKLSVCNDSMSLHMSSAFKIPTVVIFCATSPEFGYGPWKNKSIIVEKTGLDCKPCRPHGSNTCPTGTEACMNDLSSDNVINAIKDLLEL